MDVAAPETETVRWSEIEVDVAEAELWWVILFNDDVHSFDDVTHQVHKATGCGYPRAAEITLEAHQRGQAICYTGDLDRCKAVARILEEIHLLVEIVKAKTASS